MSVPITVQRKLLVRSRGYCEKRGEDFAFVEPQIHHKDRNRENNKMENLLILCPNCHSEFHYNINGTLKKKDFDMIQEFPYCQC
jgi:5-methylcytosine-specific restriction endonuclease McrA